MASQLSSLQIVKSFGWAGKTGNKNVQLQYLTIFKNQICVKTDGDWYCNCGTLKFNKKCELCLFIKGFEEKSCYYKKTFFKKSRSQRDFNERIPV